MIIPSSTYRVQLHKDFKFSDLLKILDYLQSLGIDTIYAAPIMQAVPGSMHGYDVTDPHVINPEIGTLDDLRALSRELKSRSMSWIQDIVPNHMAFSTHNARLMDVMERGRHSPYFNFFDIDWNHHDSSLNGKLMVPFLGRELDECIANKEITLCFSDEGLTLDYYETKYPVSPGTYDVLLRNLDDENRDLRQRLTEFRSAMLRESPLPDWMKFKKTFLLSLTADDLEILRDAAGKISADLQVLRSVIELQYYRLFYWKHTERIIGYRRFFTVNSLICLRMESDEVFNEYHSFIAALYQEGVIHGVRIDHIDGLNDPSGYLLKLRSLLGEDCYIIAEKILEAKEAMPGHWPLEGTSGYEFLSYVNQLFTNRNGTEKLVAFYHSLLPGMPAYDEIVLLNKRLILNGHMAGELENLVTYFFDLNLQGNFSRENIREALSLFMLSLPVYRIYPDRLPLAGASLQLVDEAIAKAKGLNDRFTDELDYILSLCTAKAGEGLPRNEIIHFLRRLMQFTGPLTAKGVEDTTFYIYNPLISHVEVGDAPSTLGITIREFHQRMIHRQQTTPFSLNATATHDTKRGEDARTRLNSISEIPDLWISKTKEWMTVNASYRKKIGNSKAPILNDEYFIYQSIVGGFPDDNKVSDEWIGRLKEYMIKVVREAKVMTNWSAPNEEYENACCDFIEKILQPGSSFLKSFEPFHHEIFPMAGNYSVAQTVIKLTAPGIPDIYQGCELFDLSYVDPDNRRPVDYGFRITLLDAMQQNPDWDSMQPFLERHATAGVSKLFATWKCLRLRKQKPKMFSHGSYVPLALSGHGGLAVAYARYLGDDWCIVVVGLAGNGKKKMNAGDFDDIFISLPANSPRKWSNIFTGETIKITKEEICVKELLSSFPVAVLSGEEVAR